MHLNIRGGSIYPESFDSAQDSALSEVECAEQDPPLAGRVEGLPFDFAQGKCA